MASAVVVIPIYKSQFSDSERLALKQIFDIFSDRPISVIHPEGLDIGELQRQFKFKSQAVDSSYFGSIKAYNRLVLSRELYTRYQEYDFMLICQTDVLILKDNIDDWMSLGYDYIGAPWINKYWQIWHNILLKDGVMNGIKALLSPRFYNAVGNGGLSLRRIASFLQVFDKLQVDHIPWTSNEDYFWGILAPEFKIPSFRSALNFSMETRPRKALKLNNNQLPMGVHAWEKFEPEVWKKEVARIEKKFG